MIQIPGNNAEQVLVQDKIINRQLSASITSSKWPTTPTSPLCEAFAFLDSNSSTSSTSSSSSLDHENDNIQYYTTWKQRYLSSLAEQAITSSDAASSDAASSSASSSLPIASYEDGIKYALTSIQKSFPNSDTKKNTNYETTLDSNLIAFSLATRAHAPQCEMYRSLSKHAISILGLASSDSNMNAFVVMDGTMQVFTSLEQLLSSSFSTISNDNMEDDTWATLLPNEEVFHNNSNKNDSDNNPILILYGQFHTKEFASFYQYLNEKKFRFVVRYIGDVDYEKNIENENENENYDDTAVRAGSTTSTTLQGYGVRVDIRNLEYKSFDEKEKGASSKPDTEISTDTDTTDNFNCDLLQDNTLKEKWMYGIDPELLHSKSCSHEMQSFLQKYMPHLKQQQKEQKQEQKQEQEYYHLPIIPQKSELKDLSLAATYVIKQSLDPLWTLIQLSQNLPSHAGPLSNITIPESLRSDTESQLSHVQHQHHASGTTIQEEGIFQFFVNGRRINVDRPSFNLFELLNVLKEENAFLKRLRNVMSDYLPLDSSSDSDSTIGKEAMDVVVSLVSMGKDGFDALGVATDGKEGGEDDEKLAQMGIETKKKLRIDVGRGYKGAVLYLNDIEKDEEYRHWPRDVQRVMMSLQYGGPPTIQKNMITTLIVIDPFDSNIEGYVGLFSVLFQMLQGGYPVRVGIIFASQKDIDDCRESISLSEESEESHYCLEKQYQGTDDNIMEQAVSPQALYTFVQYMHKNYGSAAINYLFTLLRMPNVKEMDIQTLMMVHSQLLQGMGIPMDDKSELLNELRKSESDKTKSITYEKAVRFSITKNIKPGMAFINGIPFSAYDHNEGQVIVEDEFNLLFGMIMKGEITSDRKSVYAKLLTGTNVHGKMHPLLDESEPSYRLTTSYFDTETMVVLDSNKDGSRPMILCEAIVDFTTRDGLRLAESFLSSIQQKIQMTDSPNQTSIALRVLPSDSISAGTLTGKVFRSAHEFGIDNLLLITQSMRRALLDGKDIATVNNLSGINDPIKAMLEKLVEDDSECSFLPWSEEESGSISVNGRVFKAKEIGVEDIEVMIDLAYKAANIITKKLSPFITSETSSFIAVARLASFLGNTHFSDESNSVQRSDALAPYRDIINDSSSDKSWFHYVWNDDDNENGDLKVTITVILDPLSEATQRAGPLIRTLRDDFSLPIHLILVPRLEITEDSALPITSYYRFVADSLSTLNGSSTPEASFQGLPANQVLTIRMDVPEPWDIQQGNVMQDTDNLRCDHESCGDAAYAASLKTSTTDDIASDLHLTEVQYNLNGLLFFGQCYDVSDQTPPNGLQFTLSEATSTQTEPSSGTLVMKTVGYWQLQSNPGAWKLQIAEDTRGSEIYEIVDGKVKKGGTLEVTNSSSSAKRTLLMKDFVNRMEVILVKRKSGYEEAQLFSQNDNGMDSDDDTIHVFSLATGHLYERFLKIMMLSVTKRASTKVKFWLLENFLSPSFKTSAYALAEKIGCEVEFITYKWPEWLRGQSEKQRIIWGYKILFLDVLFPLDLKKVIYVDADQVVRGDLKELMDLDLQGAPYGYTPMCESREETKGYQFWRNGFWPAHLRNKPYHISALYVVDLQQFRRQLVGDQLRSMYQQLTADPNNLSNLDQDLPNYTQHQIRIHSLPQDWLWCESWCSEETKATAKTIDLCNNPAHKEAKLSMAKRVISGDLFEESWVELDEEVLMYEEEYLSSISKQ